MSSQIKQDVDIHHLYKEGFDNLHAGLDEFVTENDLTCDDEFGYFKIYSSVAVESTDIIRTAGSFYGNEWFSDVVVSSEETEWYGKVQYIDKYLLIFIMIIKIYNILNLFLGAFIIGIFSRKR
jgi:hypothetical protein